MPDENIAGDGPNVPDHESQERGLARAGPAQDDQRLSPPNVENDPIEHFLLPEGHADVLDLDCCVSHLSLVTGHWSLVSGYLCSVDQ